eukprot:1136394-Pelagomonas_calceolata.AAC.4
MEAKLAIVVSEVNWWYDLGCRGRSQTTNKKFESSLLEVCMGGTNKESSPLCLQLFLVATQSLISECDQDAEVLVCAVIAIREPTSGCLATLSTARSQALRMGLQSAAQIVPRNVKAQAMLQVLIFCISRTLDPRAEQSRPHSRSVAWRYCQSTCTVWHAIYSQGAVVCVV